MPNHPRSQINDSNGAAASVVERTYKEFLWGEELVKEVVDPDGAALTTTTAYYEISYRQVQYRIEADGNWVRYSYDDHRRILTEQRPWLDGPSDPLTALPTQGRVTQYSYALAALAKSRRRAPAWQISELAMKPSTCVTRV